MKPRVLSLLARWALITASLSVVLFLAAGTIHIPSIRNYLAIFSSLLLVTMVAVDARLAEERAHPGCASIDGELRFSAGLFFLLTLTFAAFCVGRLGPKLNVPIPISTVSLAVFALSGSLQTWAMIVNPFFSPVVCLQTKHGHRVIAHGPYRFVRHPGYLAMSIYVPAGALAIGSWTALIPAIAFVFVIQRRARLEDEFLKRNLPGYVDYAHDVPAMLIPTRRTIRSPYVLHTS